MSSSDKMALNPETMARLFKLIQHAVSMFLLIVLFSILQYVFDMHFVCSCMPGLHLSGVLYLLLPPAILTFVVNIVEPFYRRKTFSSQRFFRWIWGSNCVIRFIIKLILRYFSLTALWISLVFFDGDWYFCLKTNLNSTLTGMPCKANLSYSEERIRDHYKTESLDIGLWLCCSFLFLWSISEIRRACKPGYRCAPYYNVVYENLLVEEVGKHLNKKLQKIAKQKAKNLCRPYIQRIQDHEDVEGGVNVSENIYKVWEKLSAPEFFIREHVRENIVDNDDVQERS